MKNLKLWLVKTFSQRQEYQGYKITPTAFHLLIPVGSSGNPTLLSLKRRQVSFLNEENRVPKFPSFSVLLF